MVNRNIENGHPCLFFWILEIFSFSLMTMMLEVDFSYMTFIILQSLPSVSTLLSIFVMKG